MLKKLRKIARRLLHLLNPFRCFITSQVVLAVIYVFLPRLISQLDNEVYWTAGVGFFGFLVVRHLEVRSKRYNALVLLEQELNSAITSLYDNINILRNLIGGGEPYFLSPRSTEMKQEVVTDISRLDLKRAAFSVQSELKRLDKDLHFTAEQCQRDFDRIQKDASFKQLYLGLLQTLLSNTQRILEQVKECASLTRFFIKNDRFMLLPQYLQPFYDKDKFSDWMVEDRKKLEQEINTDHSTTERK